MSEKDAKKSLVGPWRSLHGVIWLIGIYLLWTHNWWWPGILVLIAISGLFEGFVQRYVPGSTTEEKPVEPASPKPMKVTPPVQTPAALVTMQAFEEHRADLLPQLCPACNAPIRPYEVKWTGPQSASCPYCGTNLPMTKA